MRYGQLFDNILDRARRLGTQACLLCGGASVGAPVCAGCQGDLPRLPEDRCPVCALPTPQGTLCAGCLRHPPVFAHSEAVFRYAYPLDGLVHALKYRGELAAARYLADALAARLSGTPGVDLILAMPLHPNRLRERGFNQAAELAKHLARRLDTRLALAGARRLRDAPPQAGLSLKARIKNMRGAFACDLDLTGRQVALVDDVMTSGASLNELARAARQAGAARVVCWVVARTVKA
jgi:ComF family protein